MDPITFWQPFFLFPLKSMMKKFPDKFLIKRVLPPLFSILTLLICFTGTLSWFIGTTSLENQTSGSTAASYFAYGKGTSDSPYGINSPRHLYNLAWLQYLGTFNKDNDSDGTLDIVYFEIDPNLTGSLDMKNMVLPPIGDENHPFIGHFNGNSKTIENLTISNDFFSFSNHPYSVDSSSYSSGSILGFFGIIGQYQTTLSYDKSTNEVINLYLEDFTIRNSDTTKNILADF